MYKILIFVQNSYLSRTRLVDTQVNKHIILCNGGKFCYTFDALLAGNSCQPQVIGAVQSSTDLSRSVMTGSYNSILLSLDHA